MKIRSLLFSIHPMIEFILRNIYWRQIKLIHLLGSTFKNKNKLTKLARIPKESYKDYLEDLGIKKNDFIILHSSVDIMNRYGINPREFIDCILSIIGSDGTLMMPATPIFTNEDPYHEYLKQDLNKVYEYNVKKSPIKTGLLPFILSRYEGSRRSIHPINSTVVYGKYSNYLLMDELKDSDLKPCGKNSPWFKAVELNAKIIGIGVDLVHSLTSIHVNEDCKDEWPIKGWYHLKKFKIKSDNNKVLEISLPERKPKWGAIYFSEQQLKKDLIEKKLLITYNKSPINIEKINAKDLFNFLDSKNYNGYPYKYVDKFIVS
tara:strand:+ start:3751 stop:4704 length:954 start_codon:yes stop_codon:yes gene_type:complete